jgi:hypothetical protein
MPFCGFNAKMVQGVGIFAQGLFEAVLDRSQRENIEIRSAFEREVSEITLFLEALENKYQELRREGRPTAMTELADWIGEQNHSNRPEDSAADSLKLKTP